MYTLRLHLFLQKCVFHHQRWRKMYFVIQFDFSEMDRFLLFRFDLIWRFQNENGLHGNILDCHRSYIGPFLIWLSSTWRVYQVINRHHAIKHQYSCTHRWWAHLWETKFEDTRSLLAIVAKYGVLVNEWCCLYYAFLGVSMNKITLWKNVHVDDWTIELAIIAINVSVEFWNVLLLWGVTIIGQRHLHNLKPNSTPTVSGQIIYQRLLRFCKFTPWNTIK